MTCNASCRGLHSRPLELKLCVLGVRQYKVGDKIRDQKIKWKPTVKIRMSSPTTLTFIHVFVGKTWGLELQCRRKAYNVSGKVWSLELRWGLVHIVERTGDMQVRTEQVIHPWSSALAVRQLFFDDDDILQPRNCTSIYKIVV